MAAVYDLLDLQSQSHPESTTKYFGMSMIVHTLLIIGSFYVTVPLLENLKKEPITIEIISAVPEPPKPIVKSLEAPKGEKVAATRGAVRQNSPLPAAPMDSELDDVIKAPVAKSPKSKSTIAKLKTHTSLGKAPVPIAKSVPSRAGVPETIEDIQAPNLDFDGVLAAQQGKLGDDAFEKEFKNIDRSNAAAVNAQKAELDNEAKLISDEQDEALKSVEEDNRAQARAMDEALKTTRTKNAAAFAQVKAAEQAAAEKAAKQAALQAQRERATAEGSGKASSGRGSGNTGEDQARGGVIAGSPNGVRSLEHLRQIPGNPKPQYSVDERLRREQGLVAFHAYISKAGQPSQFRITLSTGYRNLDGKTLAALRKWKFYPGQEGWVEIPFKWDIKGGVQEMPTLLRRYGAR